MVGYKVLDAYWYTPTFPGADPVLHVAAGLPTIAVVFVAIATRTEEDDEALGWKCYMGWLPVTEQVNNNHAKAEQLIASQGAKVAKAVACAHFPGLSPDKFVY